MAIPSSRAGADIGDSHLQRGKAHARPDIPPELAAVLDDAGMHQHAEMALELAPAVEELRQAGARHLIEDRDPVGFQPRILPFPERRGRAERQEMGRK